ncbi:V-type proton ATPase subunit E-like [Neocloeon triangulifer]|uniref:V-type proton ATPase subunit E-like n=1 Tax=Neocloeon triangulifer TaxID=2078957 RepID=UPI00286F8F45|nr:V-type proton ATPase subunit E-like [Neocloeon triangulifer]
MVRGESKMVLSDEDVKKQLDHMTKFIEQEAVEKATEIDAKAEEEFNLEKGKLVQQSRLKIQEFYEKKEKTCELARKIQGSNFNNQVRLKALKVREDHIMRVLGETREVLDSVTKDREKYSKVLRLLVLQGMLQFLETAVTIQVREADLDVAESVIPSVIDEYSDITGKNCTIDIDTSNFLSAKSCGGVILKSHGNRLKIVNTLEARLELISRQAIPEMRNSLFGRNPSRKFFD